MNTSSSSSTFCRSSNSVLSSSFVKLPPVFKRSDFVFFPARKQNFKALKCYYDSDDDEAIETKQEPFSLINSNMSTDSACRWDNGDLSYYKVLESGMILLKNYINLVGQVEIVNMCQKLGVDTWGFYEPKNIDGKGLHMTCFGRNWNPVTKYKNPCRYDGSEPPQIPNELILFTRNIFKYLKKKFYFTQSIDLLSMSPDVCAVNFYSIRGRLGLHQDFDESSSSLKSGLPVVSISIGDTAEFYYGHTRNENKLERVLLESGDVLIFGGESRLIFHEVKKILYQSCPEPIKRATRLNEGRLNLTLKQF